MPGPDTSPAARLRGGAVRPADVIRTVCLLILGAGLAIALILKVYLAVLTDHVCVADEATIGNLIRCTPTLSLTAYALALAAGFELARQLFGEDDKRLLSPLVMGTTAAMFSVLSGMMSAAPGWRDALVILALVATIAGILWLREMLTAKRDP